ncbi:MAG TPA: VanW family protein [Fimbriimonadaceae bacterium]|nr:VanW family protein [Fimbriimonadaceae bacterium]
MKKFFAIAGGILALGGVWFAVVAARYQPVLRPNIKIGPVDVGGLSVEDAQRKLRLWWDTERRNPVRFEAPGLAKAPSPMTRSALGIALDDKASLAQVRPEDFWDSVQRQVGLEEAPPLQLEPVFTTNPKALKSIESFVKQVGGTVSPAKVTFEKGQIQRVYEKSGVQLESAKMAELVTEVAQSGTDTIVLPLVEAPKKIADTELDKIKEVRSTFTTKFPTSKVSRCSNIKLASSIIHGTILAPGEQFSFNGVVGRRTIAAGFKVAGVLKNGRHDTDVGGGICQVSTTLYNAALLSNLKIVKRSNHSIPISYVPLGRDATVDYGTHDLVFENTLDHPIALAAKYEPGKLTFSILGTKTPGMEVKITTQRLRSWSAGTKYVNDASLAPGKQKVIDKGGGGHSVVTFRAVLVNGEEVSKERLNASLYRGGARIVAVNRAPKPAAAKPAAPTPGIGTTTTTGPVPVAPKPATGGSN